EKPTAGQRILAPRFAKPAPQESPDRGEQHPDEHERAEPENEPVERGGLAERNTFHRHHRRRAEEAAHDPAAAVRLKRDQPIAELFTIEKRANRHESRVAEGRVHHETTAVGPDANVAGEADRLLESRIGSAIELVIALHALRLRRRIRRDGDGSWREW